VSYFQSGQSAELADGQRIRLFAEAPSCNADWATLLASGWSAPYQTPCWVQAWLEGVQSTGRCEPCFILLQDRDETPICLFPLVISTRGSMRIAEFCGQKHANFHVGLFHTGKPRPTADQLQAMFKMAAQLAGIDCYSFFNQPVDWQGARNPLTALPHSLSANHAFKIDLTENGEALIQTLMSGETRKKLRNKEKRLTEIGPVRLEKAKDDAERAVFLTAFMEQKALRFAFLGKHNPFAEADVERFLTAGIRRAPSGHVPIEIYALRAGDRFTAIIGVAEHGGRASGMFLSYDASPEVARFSPGDILLNKLVQHLCSQRMAIFDLGTGDAEYKKTYCPVSEPLFDTVLPMTSKGQLAAIAMRLSRRARYTLKNQPMAVAIHARFKRLKASR
jgi:CelD/BcsL family acetyltransferase involved in cellulose biosynthesis